MYLPYVYKMVHKTTGHFYIGMRSANKCVAELDLGVKYFTSNKIVKNDFSMYDRFILAYFKNAEYAFIFENELIRENFKDPLILNKHFQKTFSNFSMAGFKRTDLSALNVKHKTLPREIRAYVCQQCNSTFEKNELVKSELRKTPVCSYKCSNIINAKNRKSSKGISKFCAAAGWNKGKPNPQAAINAKNSAGKISKTCTGRKMAIREDGTRYWINPDKS